VSGPEGILPCEQEVLYRECINVWFLRPISESQPVTFLVILQWYKELAFQYFDMDAKSEKTVSPTWVGVVTMVPSTESELIFPIVYHNPSHMTSEAAEHYKE
jgi:hypothetical protein